MMWNFLLFLFSSVWVGSFSTKKAVKIVQEPANYGGLQSHQSNNIQPRPTLKPFRKQAPFSGPYHLRKLFGKCFSLTDNSYTYELCPFHNITQYEQTWRWNAFQGILGIWKEWSIVNNTFQAMMMTDGDECPGNIHRESKIFLKCGQSNNLVSVKEPNTCKYEFSFETPLACPVDALLVYPMLSSKAQKEWEDIEESLYHEELTIQGYHKQRHHLFVSAGLLAPLQENGKQTGEVEETLPKSESQNTSFIPKTHDFNTKQECFQAYSQLLQEFLKLRQLLEKQKSEKTTYASQISNVEFPTGNMLRARGDSGLINNRTDVRTQ